MLRGGALLCLAACLCPENSTVTALAFAFRFAWWLGRLPFTWDSEIMEALTDLAVIVHLVAADGPSPRDASALIGTSIRRQMGWFYLFAGFWKINTSFLDPRYSCASIYLAQLLDAYAPPAATAE